MYVRWLKEILRNVGEMRDQTGSRLTEKRGGENEAGQ